jgi:hypothetical protein
MSVSCPKCGKEYVFDGKSFKAHTQGYLSYRYVRVAGYPKIGHSEEWIPPVCDIKGEEE